MAEMPWSKFFWSDWESDQGLRLCSLSAQGLWMRMLCVCARHDPKGYLSINGNPLKVDAIARLAGVAETEAEILVAELELNGVFSRNRAGCIFSRRMVKDEKRSQEGRKHKKRGLKEASEKKERIRQPSRGAPSWPSPQKPEARGHRLERSSSTGGDVAAQAPAAAALLPEAEFRERLIVAAGGHPSGINPATGRPTAIGDPADMLAVSDWVDRLGLTEVEIISVIRSGAAKKRGSPASSLRFFSGHMEDFAGQKNQNRAPHRSPDPPLTDPKAEAESQSLRAEWEGLRGSNADDAFSRRQEILARLQELKSTA